MELDLLLEGLDLGNPGRRKDGSLGIEMRPAVGGVSGRQRAKESQNPLGSAAIAATNPVALRIGGAGCQWLDEGRGIEAGGECPDDLQSCAALHVEELEDHGASLTECGKSGKGFGD